MTREQPVRRNEAGSRNAAGLTVGRWPRGVTVRGVPRHLRRSGAFALTLATMALCAACAHPATGVARRLAGRPTDHGPRSRRRRSSSIAVLLTVSDLPLRREMSSSLRSSRSPCRSRPPVRAVIRPAPLRLARPICGLREGLVRSTGSPTRAKPSSTRALRRVESGSCTRRVSRSRRCGSHRAAEMSAPPTGDGNDTASFACRPSTGSTTWSRHTYRLAIDVNPFHNPTT